MRPIIVKGRNMEVGELLRQYIQEKMKRLAHHLEAPAETTVEVAKDSGRGGDARFVVEVTMLVSGSILRGEEKAAEPHSAVDAVVDVMDRQIERFKGKHFERRRRAGQTRIAEAISPEEEAALELADEETPEPFTGKVVKHKRFSMKPMFEEEAAEQMELLGHSFFFFLNAGTGQYNLLYRRQDGDYGLIEPEVG